MMRDGGEWFGPLPLPEALVESEEEVSDARIEVNEARPGEDRLARFAIENTKENQDE